ncbi:hypothetical protein TR70_2131 [Burkholderia pseudomallei]|uniref:hypothetical protein n=1 Tax=Burkholderia pseudomallei TaxID=28450 RepID=UPI000706D78C|nr:hypothetical protein [Burkholderia pseudomallei]ALJ71659.1 hypothetical protein TR70_2131 [Burkholderia pseudomallei]
MSSLNVGIDDNTSLVYEGSLSLYGHAVWPSPFLSVVSHIGELSAWRRDQAVINLMDAPMLFREDSFDPVARVRRGRLYVRRQQENPAYWRVQRHPAYATSGLTIPANRDSYGGPDERGFFSMWLTTFESWRISENFLKKRHNAVLVIGGGDRGLVHQILDVERLATGEELITLRTRPSMSGLPELIAALIPERYAALVVEQYEKAASAAYRDDAESVIDRCREAASAALNAGRFAKTGDDTADAKDLGALGTFFVAQGMEVVGNAALILARWHSRGKSAERINRDTVPPSEADAHAAVSLLGLIYRELRWTR